MEDSLITADGIGVGVSSQCLKGARIRSQQTGEFHFLTFSCYRRRSYFESAAAMDLFEDALRQNQRYCVLSGLGAGSPLPVGRVDLATVPSGYTDSGFAMERVRRRSLCGCRLCRGARARASTGQSGPWGNLDRNQRCCTQRRWPPTLATEKSRKDGARSSGVQQSWFRSSVPSRLILYTGEPCRG